MSNDKMRQEKIELLRMLREAGYPAIEAVEAIGTYGTTASAGPEATTASEAPVVEPEDSTLPTENKANAVFATVCEYCAEEGYVIGDNARGIGRSCSNYMRRNGVGLKPGRAHNGHYLYPRWVICEVLKVRSLPRYGK